MNYFQELLTIGLLFLLVFIFSLNKKENFTDVERKSALDNLKIQNDLFNSVFNKITKDDVIIPKKLIVNNNIETTGKDIKNGKITLGANGTIYTDKINIKDSIEKVGKINAKELCIDGICINKSHLEALTGRRDIFIKSGKVNRYLQSGDFTTSVKGSDHGHNLKNAAEFDGGGKGDWEKLRFEL